MWCIQLTVPDHGLGLDPCVKGWKSSTVTWCSMYSLLYLIMVWVLIHEWRDEIPSRIPCVSSWAASLAPRFLNIEWFVVLHLKNGLESKFIAPTNAFLPLMPIEICVVINPFNKVRISLPSFNIIKAFLGGRLPFWKNWLLKFGRDISHLLAKIIVWVRRDGPKEEELF